MDKLRASVARAAERVARTVQGDDGHGGATDLTAWDALVHLVRPAHR